ncbi:MAG: carbon-nitrogen hydrolase family protein [Chloroflexota bacterium]
MSHPPTLRLAAIQMDVRPAPTYERLERADRLVAQAAAQGARLVLLPEVFNTGYAYVDENFQRAETLDGPTIAWMQETAARLDIHLAGSLLLFSRGQIHNALILAAPNGRIWRYDKRYPWGWERAYSRPGSDLTIAHTELGDIGLLICWDVAHAHLWQGYAGQVHLVLVASCPPDIGHPTYHLPDGRQVTWEELGPVAKVIRHSLRRIFGDTIEQQAAWLGVPLAITGGCGHFHSPVPRGRAALLSLALTAPWLLRYLPQADHLELSCHITPACKILDAHGQVVAECTQEQGETFILAEVELPQARPQPGTPQPRPPVPWIAYLFSDVLLPALVRPIYQHGVQRAWGPSLPSPGLARNRRALAAGLLLLGSAFLWLLLRRRK